MYDRMFLILYWIGFFMTTVLGHVGLKFSTQNSETAMTAILSKLGIICALSWVASFYFWTLILMRQDLMLATSISNLRYPIICLAAFLFFEESLSSYSLIGILLVLFGLLLIRQGTQV